MKKLIVALSAFIFLNFAVKTQSEIISIYIDAIEQNYLHAQLNIPDTITLSNNRKAIVQLFDYRGNMYIKVVKGKKLLCEGKYNNSLDTLKRYVESYSMDGTAKLEVKKYFSPVKDSVWTFYNEHTKRYDKKIYKNGIQLKGNL